MDSRKHILLPVLVGLGLALGLVLGMLITRDDVVSGEVNDLSRKYKEILGLIHKDYVDTVDLHKFEDEAIQKALEQLDPHTKYIPKSNTKVVDAQLESNFEGVGVEFQILDDTLLVTNVIHGGPSEKAGVLLGDKILIVDGDSIAGIGLTINKVFDLLRGPRGSKVEIAVNRFLRDSIINLTIERGKIPTSSIEAAYMVSAEVGLIRVSRFAEDTYHEFYEALQTLQKQGMSRLVLDLRGNGGGFLNQAVLMLEEFLPRGSVLVKTNGKNPSTNHAYTVNKGGIFQTQPIIVLVDEYSASASEIVSGALQDNDRALILGRRTFGKGLVQTSYTLIDGSFLRLTVSRYYTPSGRCIQRSYEDSNQDYEMDIHERYLHGELFHEDSIKFIDSLRYTTLSGRPVFGGGGIVPDVFIPKDTVGNSSLFNTLISQSTLRLFSIEYTLLHLEELKNGGFDVFLQNFEMDEGMMEGLKFYAEEKLQSVSNEWNKDKLIKKYFKAFLARNIWGEQAMFKVLNYNDPMVLLALEKFVTDSTIIHKKD